MFLIVLSSVVFVISVIWYWLQSSPLKDLPTYEDLKALEEANNGLKKQS